jgi:hypothetical protein
MEVPHSFIFTNPDFNVGRLPEVTHLASSPPAWRDRVVRLAEKTGGPRIASFTLGAVHESGNGNRNLPRAPANGSYYLKKRTLAPLAARSVSALAPRALVAALARPHELSEQLL